MPRPSKQTSQTAITSAQQQGWMTFVCAAKLETAKWNEVSKTTRLDYEAKAKKLASKDGVEFHVRSPATRKLYKAAGLWVMRKKLKALLKEAKNILTKKNELFEVQQAEWLAKMQEAEKLLVAIEELKGVDCVEAGKHGMQASHKKTAATDHDLKAFYKWAEKNSSFTEAFLVMEFTGCRGEEFEKGIKIEATKIDGKPMLRFLIESAKCDGDKKGLEVRSVIVPYPKNATEDVQRRWLKLANKAASEKKGYTVTVERKGKSTAGRRITEACRTCSEGAGVKVSAYSMRHRFSAQVKASSKEQENGAENVALALGHQTTNTQTHYGRSHRGKGGISPMEIVGVNVSGIEIRGAKKRTGPPTHLKERAILSKGGYSSSKRTSRRL